MDDLARSQKEYFGGWVGRLREVLADHGLTHREFYNRLNRYIQEAYGKSSGIAKAESTFNRYLAGAKKPDPRWLVAAADFLDVSVDWLLTGRGVREPTKKELLEAMEAAGDATQDPYFVLSTRVQNATDDLVVPWAAKDALLNLVRDLYMRFGPKAFGLDAGPEEWNPDEAMRRIPDELSAGALRAWIERELPALRPTVPVPVGARIAQCLNAISAVYIQRLGGYRVPS